MSQSVRQSELFSGEDWTVLFQGFSQINFNATDPESINLALQDYIQTNYPEDFNDWIESSEFVAIIDLLSWLAGSLAFRTDINSRENFLETANAKESVLRLARMLSYNPRRAQSARGLVKITEIKTTQSVIDSLGKDLSNLNIVWNDPDNSDWYEHFIAILNATFPAINQFGVPIKEETISGTRTQLYPMNTVVNPNCVYDFNAAVDGENDRYEIVNADIAPSGFSEVTPDPYNQFRMIYRNDGRGFASARTGFFFFFKQGMLQKKKWSIENRRENRLIDIKTRNVSETDVWVQTLNDNDIKEYDWTKIPAIFSDNITFNSVGASIRNIFSVITRSDDTVSLRFSDGRFGAVPYGNIRAWFRTVNGRQYVVRPREIDNVTITIPYNDNFGRRQNLQVKFSLQEEVRNALGPETIEQVKQRAPQVYGTQNRMVSGEDYNVFPLTTNEIIKLRSVNRVYSGQSRYLDINDPTATYQDTTIFSNDGILYKDYEATQYTQVSLASNYSTEQIIGSKIQPMLQHSSVRNFFLDYMLGKSTELGLNFSSNSFVWNTIKSDSTSSIGNLDGTQASSDPCGVGNPYASATNSEKEHLMNYLNVDAKLKFEWNDNGKTIVKWVKVITSNTDVSGDLCEFAKSITDPLFQPLIIDESVPNGAVLKGIIPAYRTNLDTRQMIRTDLGRDSEFKRLEDFVSQKIPFSLWYVPDENSRLAYNPVVLPGQWHITNVGDPSPSTHAVKVLTGSYSDGIFWSFETLVGTRYIFESVNDVRWANTKDQKVVSETGQADRDRISVIWPKYEPNGIREEEISFDIIDNVYYQDGLADLRKVIVVPSDYDNDGVVDIPNSFQYVVGDDDYALFSIDRNEIYEKLIPLIIPQYNNIPVDFYGDIIFIKTDKLFYKWNGTEYIEEDQNNYKWYEGSTQLRYKWQHFAGTDYRIDPAITNIIDMFVLTSDYDMLTRQWIEDGSVEDVPQVPTPLDLRTRFAELEDYKMATDQIIWRPVKYKFLFGNKSIPELQATFKVIKLPSTSLSDGEIKSRIITVINDYFDVNNWEFGETFFFTELAAYIHLQMSTVLSSVVIVPTSNNGVFGELFEVRCDPNEMFISTAQVDDVVIIDGNTVANLRM